MIYSAFNSKWLLIGGCNLYIYMYVYIKFKLTLCLLVCSCKQGKPSHHSLIFDRTIRLKFFYIRNEVILSLTWCWMIVMTLNIIHFHHFKSLDNIDDNEMLSIIRHFYLNRIINIIMELCQIESRMGSRVV